MDLDMQIDLANNLSNTYVCVYICGYNLFFLPFSYGMMIVINYNLMPTFLALKIGLKLILIPRIIYRAW